MGELDTFLKLIGAEGESRREQMDDIIHKLSVTRRQLEDVHSWCDINGLPKTIGSETLTARGRLEEMGRPNYGSH